MKTVKAIWAVNGAAILGLSVNNLNEVAALVLTCMSIVLTAVLVRKNWRDSGRRAERPDDE